MSETGLFAKKLFIAPIGCLSGPAGCPYQKADGNAAAADSTAVFSFASMVRMLQSMAAVKRTAKREVLFMVNAFPVEEKVVSKSCFQELDA